MNREDLVLLCLNGVAYVYMNRKLLIRESYPTLNNLPMTNLI
jgi:hypothetical protein